MHSRVLLQAAQEREEPDGFSSTSGRQKAEV